MRDIVISASYADYEKSCAFIEELLKRNRITGEIYSQTMLIFEALFYNLIIQESDNNTVIRLMGEKSLGDLRIKIGFEGKTFDPLSSGEREDSPENRILRAYADKIDYSYHSGRNYIRITIKRSHLRNVLLNLAGIMAAIAVYIPVFLTMDAEKQGYLKNQFVYPIETVFANAILMVGTLVTFLSILKNLTDAYIISERVEEIRKMHWRIIATSVVVALLAVIVSLLTSGIVGENQMLVKYRNMGITTSFSEMVSSIMPSSIFASFEGVNPFPLIIVTMMTAYALCSVGKYFDTLKTAIDACYVLCSRMLRIIMFTLPFFIFMAFMDMLLNNGFIVLLYQLELIFVIVFGLLVVAVFYIIRLKINRIGVLSFVKTLIPLLHENLIINSSIDAVPFNIRYCVRNYGMKREDLQNSLPLLSQLNLEGNCFLITQITLFLIFVSGTMATWGDVFTIVVLVLFLSVGAPNQPGSCVIGVMIILTFVNAFDLLPLAIYSEVFFGGMLNLVNVIGDIVFVSIEDARRKKKTRNLKGNTQ